MVTSHKYTKWMPIVDVQELNLQTITYCWAYLQRWDGLWVWPLCLPMFIVNAILRKRLTNKTTW